MPETILNIFGIMKGNFIEEVTDRVAVISNRLYFILLVNGIPRDTGFGVGLSEMVAEQNTIALKREIESRTTIAIEDGTLEDVLLRDLVIERDVSNQKVNVDFYFDDIYTGEEILVPLAL